MKRRREGKRLDGKGRLSFHTLFPYLGDIISSKILQFGVYKEENERLKINSSLADLTHILSSFSFLKQGKEILKSNPFLLPHFLLFNPQFKHILTKKKQCLLCNKHPRLYYTIQNIVTWHI